MLNDLIDTIHIDANRADEEPFRLERLDILRRLLIYHRHYCYEMPALVTHLYEHKGDLAVNWTARPDAEQCGLLGDLWEVFCECAENVEHFVQGQPLADPSGWGYAPFPIDK